jgi:hypothetical protein
MVWCLFSYLVPGPKGVEDGWGGRGGGNRPGVLLKELLIYACRLRRVKFKKLLNLYYHLNLERGGGGGVEWGGGGDFSN